MSDYELVTKIFKTPTEYEWEAMHGMVSQPIEENLGKIDVPFGLLVKGNRIRLPYSIYAREIFDVEIQIAEKRIIISLYS